MHPLLRLLETIYRWVHDGFEEGGNLVGLFRLAIVIGLAFALFGAGLPAVLYAIFRGLTESR